MNSIRVLGILVTLLIIVILGQKYFLNPIEKRQKTLISPTPTVFKEEQNQPSNTPAPIINKNQNSKQNEDLIYPGSVKIKNDNGNLELESLDDAQKITDWYKEKIKGMGMNAKSFVQTKANDKVLNKLVGSNGKKEVRVEISKENNQSTVKIFVIVINP
ncbi:MAG: hypothetical protein M1268_02345 [Patescibacteria group bacterium]|nr:hypothetical protein [Patescibacteria group bacterium]